VNPGTGLTSNVTGSTVTLNVDTTKVPQLSAANTFTASQTVIGSVSATNVSAIGITGGVVNAMSVNATGAVNSRVVNATTSFDIGGTPFAFAYNSNAFLGFAGNSTMSGSGNTASGYNALASNTTGFANTANGYQALYANTISYWNIASGYQALSSNIGYFNTANGVQALYLNASGS
jgi:hypothetical protein